jgi:hypothetical protein
LDRFDRAHDAPRSGRGLTARGCAVLCLAEPHAELATMLILQELGLSVDLAVDPESAVRWVQRARYELIVVGGAPMVPGSVVLRLRHAAPDARIVILAEDAVSAEDLAPFGVQVLGPPLDVNSLMQWLWPAS